MEAADTFCFLEKCLFLERNLLIWITKAVFFNYERNMRWWQACQVKSSNLA